MRQMTSLKSHIIHQVISLDGTIVAFGSDPQRRGRHDLMLLDVATGEVKALSLLRRLEKRK